MASRRELPLDVPGLQLEGRAGLIDERDLALTEAEAADALRLLGADLSPRDAVAATGGWMAGVMFEGWRAGDPAAGGGGRADPLHGYLARNMVDQLSEAERGLLLTTSVLQEVTTKRARALGIDQAGATLAALRARHLPATWGRDPVLMRCHPRFREYLLERFAQDDPGRIRAVRRRLARQLLREGHPEEAVEAFLVAGALEEGAAVADGCIVSIVERLDFDVAERWLAAFAATGASTLPGFVTAELMICVWTDDPARGVALGDRLNAAGERARLARSSSLTAALLAINYGTRGIRPAEARNVLDIAPAGPAIDAARYTLTIADDELADPGAVPPSVTGGPLDLGILRAHYHRGELAVLAEEPPLEWDVAVEPWRILAMQVLGQTGRALERYERAGANTSAVWMAGVELMIDLGQPEEARRLLALAPPKPRAGVLDPFVPRAHIQTAKLALRFGRDTATARRELQAVLCDPRAASLPFLREHAATWLGLTDLLDGRDGDARAQLRQAVARMTRSGLRLMLPAAAVYLAEAEWRVGDEDAADGAADIALGAAEFQGSNHILLQALADFPAVAWRRADAEATADSAWHRFGRSLRAAPVPAAMSIGPEGRVQVVEFGEPHLLVAGQEIRPRLSKALTLLAVLAAEPTHRVPRRRVILDLFESGSDESTVSYLRLAVRAAREVLAEAVEIGLDRDYVRCAPPGSVASESRRFEGLLAAADRMAGAARFGALMEAIAIARRGAYLEGDSSPWAVDRRGQLEELAERALLDASVTAYELGEYRQAEQLVRDGLARNRFRESGWRLLMRVAAATHDGDGVIEAYRGAERALAEIGARPSAATVALLGELRR